MKLFRPVSEEAAGAAGWHREQSSAAASAQPDGGHRASRPRSPAPPPSAALRLPERILCSCPKPGWLTPAQRREPLGTPTCQGLRRHRGTSEGRQSTAPGPQHVRGALGAPAPLDEPTATRERPPRDGSANGAPRDRAPRRAPRNPATPQVTEGTFS